MTNKEIYNLYGGLNEISQNSEYKFNIKTSYILAKNKNLLEPLYQAIIMTRQKLFDKYGEPQEDGGWLIPKQQVTQFTQEWDTFMEIENIVNVQKISIDSLEENKLGIDIVEKLLPIIEN